MKQNIQVFCCNALLFNGYRVESNWKKYNTALSSTTQGHIMIRQKAIYYKLHRQFKELVVPIVNQGTFPVGANLCFTLVFRSFMHHKSENELNLFLDSEYAIFLRLLTQGLHLPKINNIDNAARR